jgi:hypothetical protein
VNAEAERGSHPIASPDAWWALVLGSGYRGTVEQLTPEQFETVRRNNLAVPVSVETNVVYATAKKS